jgi:ribosomal protein L21
MRCVRYSVFLRKGKGFWEGKSLKIVVARFFLFSRIANKLNCIFATLKSINQFGMYAIVEIAGQQFKVSKDLKVYVHRLTNEEGTTVSFDKVYLLDDNGVITIGAHRRCFSRKVLQHLKGDKVIVFKRKEEKDTKEKWSQTVSLKL